MRTRVRMPRWVALTEDDRLLPVDLDNVISVDGLVHHLLRRPRDATFTELFHGPDDVWVRGDEGRYTHELVVPFLRVPHTRPAPSPASRRSALQVPSVARAHPPGSDWLYAKLYTGPAAADDILREVVRPVVRHAQQAARCDKWFFIRYGDPAWHVRLRIHGDRSRLLREVLPCLVDTVAPFLSDETLQGMQLDTYEPEIERYGGPEGMLLAERLFCVDSEAVLTALEALALATHRTETEAGPENALAADPDGRWRLCLVNMDRILRGLGMSLTARRAATTAARDTLAEELSADRALRRGIGERYRSERGVLEHLMGPDSPGEGRRRTTAPRAGSGRWTDSVFPCRRCSRWPRTCAARSRRGRSPPRSRSWRAPICICTRTVSCARPPDLRSWCSTTSCTGCTRHEPHGAAAPGDRESASRP